MLCCLRVWHRVPAQQEKEGEKARLELEPLQLEGCVVWPLLYGGLGKTRECGASEVSGLPHQDTSSTMNLFLFKKNFCFLFSSAGRPILTSFFLLPPLFIFFSFVQKRAYFFFFLLCLTEEWEKNLYVWFIPYMTMLCPPFSVLSGCISLLQPHAWGQEFPVNGLAVWMQ